MKLDARTFEQAALWAAYSAPGADWRKLDERSELGAAMQLATVRLRDAMPAAVQTVAYVELIL